MFLTEKKVLEELVEEMRDYPFFEKIEEMVIFGSRVRGDFDVESDFDILVVVNAKDIETETALIRFLGRKEDASGVPFSPVIKDKKTYDKEKRYMTGFARAIEEEGITIYRKDV